VQVLVILKIKNKNRNEAVFYWNNTKQMDFLLHFNQMMQDNKMILIRVISQIRVKEPIHLIMIKKIVLLIFQNLRVVRHDNQLPEHQ
jgi:hypothetical protein